MYYIELVVILFYEVELLVVLCYDGYELEGDIGEDILIVEFFDIVLKFGVLWCLIEDLLFCVSWGEVFRIFIMSEMFVIIFYGFLFVYDIYYCDILGYVELDISYCLII